jgi:two-component system response regulator MprA
MIASASIVAAASPPSRDLRYGDLALDPDTRSVSRAGRTIELTPTEFRLLELFLRNPDRVLGRSLIFKQVWGFDFGVMSNSLNVYVGYVRRKIEAGGEPRLIQTVRGEGYVLRHAAARGLSGLLPDS